MKRLVPALLALLILLPAQAARAASTEVGIADDRILLAGGPHAAAAVAEWHALGVDTVRIFALWSRIAPATHSAGFEGADPNSPFYSWGALDAAVARVRAAGMKVTLTITGPGPLWTSTAPNRHRPAYRPRPSDYADFATAVALRYGADVDRYLLWNEPNIPTWLYPQARCSHGHCTAVSPHLYRGLVRAAYPAVHKADPGAQVVIGVLSPRGQRLRRVNTVIRPLAFLRAFGCRSDRWTRLRTSECRSFRPATGDGFAIHPYGGRIAPERAHPSADDVSLAQVGHLTATLDRLQRARAVRATTRHFGIFVDEYGYQTNPPDKFAGVSARTQDAWLQRAAYLAWRTPRIRLFTQYLWRDEPRSDDGSFGGWQSGLRYTGGRAKPALAHFDTPFVLDAARNRLWGQVRPGGAQTVTVQKRASAHAAWHRLAVVTTDARGYWTLSRRLLPGSFYRYRAAGATSATLRR